MSARCNGGARHPIRGLATQKRDVRWKARYDDIPRTVSTAQKNWPDNDEPVPLFPPIPPSAPYPVDALGSLLAKAANAISNKIQVPVAMAAQSVLAAAALAAQAHCDVRLPFGQQRPLSLFFVTVAASGDRKSSADNEALRPIRRYEICLKRPTSRS